VTRAEESRLEQAMKDYRDGAGFWAALIVAVLVIAFLVFATLEIRGCNETTACFEVCERRNDEAVVCIEACGGPSSR
jgi:hypothetical protein